MRQIFELEIRKFILQLLTSADGSATMRRAFELEIRKLILQLQTAAPSCGELEKLAGFSPP
jgi:hypothetical protein